MLRRRAIPVLLISGQGLYKSVKFGERRYVGDPLNAIHLFNEMEVDELIVLDIDASRQHCEPNYSLIEHMASQCFMPLCYGGGISQVEQARRIFSLGIEKVAVNQALHVQPGLVTSLADVFGSQSVVASLDVRQGLLGRAGVYDYLRKRNLKLAPKDLAVRVQALGAGEILLNSVDRDGTMGGFDLPVIEAVASAVDVPVVACGGAGTLADFARALDAGASAVAAGSMFVFKGKHRAVLINYPNPEQLDPIFDTEGQPC